MDWAKIIESTGGGVAVALFAFWIFWLTQKAWFAFMTAQTQNIQNLVKAISDQTEAVNALLSLENQRTAQDEALRREVEECHKLLCILNEPPRKRRG